MRKLGQNYVWDNSFELHETQHNTTQKGIDVDPDTAMNDASCRRTNDIQRIFEVWEALDNWLISGGFLPQDRQPVANPT